MGTTLLFMAVAGLLAMAIRTQLARPGATILDSHAYNQIFTLHGTAMIFLVIAPFALGLANYLIPLQIGAPDMAFPRLNATSYWMFLFGGLIVFAGAATNEGAASAGWTSYAPLSEIKISTGLGQDFWIVGLAMVSVASIMTAINFVTTAFIHRAPGMTMWRLPIFTWEMIATSLLIFMAFPSLTATLLLLFVDRHMGGHVFDPAFGGSPILYQHLFWFFGHPEVYVLILPYFGVVSEVISTFSGRPLFGYTGMVLAAFAIAGLSMGVWAHHMFTTGAVNNPFFAFVSFLIAVPTGIKFFNWICTMWGGSIRYTTAMLYAVGFLMNFLVGGVTGVMVASPPLDFQAQDSYFVVAHFHYTIGGGSFFALFAALYYWWPKVYGWRLGERSGQDRFLADVRRLQRHVHADVLHGRVRNAAPRVHLRRRRGVAAAQRHRDRRRVHAAARRHPLRGERRRLGAAARTGRRQPVARLHAGVGDELAAAGTQFPRAAADPLGAPAVRRSSRRKAPKAT